MFTFYAFIFWVEETIRDGEERRWELTLLNAERITREITVVEVRIMYDTFD